MEPNYDAIANIITVAAAVVGSAALAALIYPLVNRYGLWGISPKEEENWRRLREEAEKESQLEIKLDHLPIKYHSLAFFHNISK